MDDTDAFLASLNQFSSGSLASHLERHQSQLQQRTVSSVSSGSAGAAAAAKKRERRSVSGSAPRSWACAACTLVNEGRNGQCDACGAPPPGLPAGGWACHRCGAANPPDEAAAAGRRPRCVSCGKRCRRDDAAAAAEDEDPSLSPLDAAPPEFVDVEADDGDEAAEAAAAAEGAEEEFDEMALANGGEDDDASVDGDGWEEDEESEEEWFDEDEEEEALGDDDDDVDHGRRFRDVMAAGGDDEGAAAGVQLPRRPRDGRRYRRRRHRRNGATAAAGGDGDDGGGRREEEVQIIEKLNCASFEDLPLAPVPPAISLRAATTGVAEPLKDFQRQGLHWLLSREEPAAVEPGSGPSPPPVPRGGILADYMGLGKTRMLIALCEAARRSTRDGRAEHSRVRSAATLVVCPMSLMAQWAREIAAVAGPERRVLRYYGQNRNRRLFEVAQQYDYVLTSYQTLVREPPVSAAAPGKLNLIHWHRVILDEAHYIRNPRAAQSKACLELAGERKWAATGTPIQNKLDDLFTLFKFVGTPNFDDARWWLEHISGPLADDLANRAAGLALEGLLSRLVLRRVPSSMVRGRPLLELPPKVVETVRVPFTPDERDFYDALHKNAAVKLDRIVRRDTKLLSYMTAFEMLMRSRQACLHPFLVVAALKRKREANRARGEDDGADADGVDVQAEVRQFVARLKRQLLDGNGRSEFALEVVRDIESQNLEGKECIICLDTLQRPALLPCAHVFCEACIASAVRMQQRCPLCKRPARAGDIHVIPERVVVAPQPPGVGPTLDSIDAADHSKWRESSKIAAFLRLFDEVPADEKVIVFSFFSSILQYLARVLEARGATFALYTGAVSAKRRDVIVTQFNTKPAPRVLLATITTCGVGINLTRATRCFILDPSWNPGVEEQAMNRLHRIGQTRPVRVTRLVIADSVEENIDRLCAEKKELADYAMSDTRSTGTTLTRRMRLGRQEILRLMGVGDGDGGPPPAAAAAAAS